MLTSLDADSGAPFVGVIDVGRSDDCEQCTTVRLSGRKELMGGPLLANAPEDVDDGNAHFELRLTMQEGEIVLGELQYRANSWTEGEWEIDRTVDLEL
jgi:hypothetical protein